MKVNESIDLIVRDVAELPDRNSPDNQPEMMLVTDAELRTIIGNRHAEIDSIESQIKAAIETYEATIFICENCGKLAYMVDPGDGLITHIN